MAPANESEWTAIYETKSSSDADLVRTTLEVAGFRVAIDSADPGPSIHMAADIPGALTISVPSEDADDARTFLREKTSLTDSPPPVSGEGRVGALTESLAAAQATVETETIEDAAKDVLELRGQHEAAACKYCGIATLDVSEADLDSHAIALLRAVGLGVNSATFSDFQAGERICAECAGHEVTCDICGRTLDAFLDEGEYRRANADEAFICSSCLGQLEDQLTSDRDW